MANFHLSVPEEMYAWLLREKKRLGADKVQDVIRKILTEAKEKAEAERHG